MKIPPEDWEASTENEEISPTPSVNQDTDDLTDTGSLESNLSENSTESTSSYIDMPTEDTSSSLESTHTASADSLVSSEAIIN